MKFFSLILFALCGMLLRGADDSIVIVNTTDTHSTLQSCPAIWQARKNFPEAIFIDCGDVMQGSPNAMRNQGWPQMQTLAQLKYDAFIPGNHDFEYGSEALLNAVKLLPAGNAIAANIRGSELIKPFRIVERGQYRIGIVGLAEVWTPYRTMELASLTFTEEKIALSSALKELKKANVDVIILARHGGQYFRNGSLYELMKTNPEIDLVLGGHSHDQVSGKKIGPGFFVQVGARGEVYAVIRLFLDPQSRQLKRITSKLIPLKGDVDSVDMDSKIISPTSLPTDNAGVAQLAMKSMLHAVPEASAAAIITGKHDFASGNTEKALFERFPFANRLWTIKLSRSEFSELQCSLKKFLPSYQTCYWLDQQPSSQEVILVLSSYDLAGAGRENSPLRTLHKNHQMSKQQPTLFEAAKDFLSDAD